ncbi:MAG: hypothetical protein E4H01_11375 [Lysobacterales bacterium]|nr:MAG: hypothetical protein E4H01_11375 [Xanthomonadales bacterium]
MTRLRLIARSPEEQIIASGTDFLIVVPDLDKSAGSHALNKRPVTVAVPRDGEGPARIVSQADPASGSAAKSGGLSIELVEYNSEGNFRIAGRAPAGARLRVLVGGATLGQTAATADGNWRLALQGPTEPGQRIIAVEQVDASGNLVARTEVPLGHTVSAAPALPPGSITVEPGDNLWRIARRAYGQGVLHTVIYGFNAEQIKDPDKIRPKTLLTAPGAE